MQEKQLLEKELEQDYLNLRFPRRPAKPLKVDMVRQTVGENDETIRN